MKVNCKYRPGEILQVGIWERTPKLCKSGAREIEFCELLLVAREAEVVRIDRIPNGRGNINMIWISYEQRNGIRKEYSVRTRELTRMINFAKDIKFWNS